MKRSLLLLCGAAGLSLSAAAQTFVAPTIHENLSFQHISPDGRFVVSEVYGNLTILDLKENKSYEYLADDTGTIYYTAGLGNSVSNTGVVLASTQSICDAAYWQDGEWHNLNVPEGGSGLNHLSHGITPDGKRICGNVGVHEVDINKDALMCAPAYWDLKDDGTYGEFHRLPHPELDWSGRTPQYVTAVAISDDGRVIAGQVVDCSGFLCSPIVYTQADNGEWSYSLPGADMINPDKIELPAYPGENSMAPEAVDFMSPEKRAEYEAAYTAWVQSGFEGDAPEGTDYLTPEQAAAYEAAYSEWETASDEWMVKYNEWYDAFSEVISSSAAFTFNNVCLSPDGTSYVATRETEMESPDSWWPIMISDPYVFDVATGKVTFSLEGSGISVTQMPSNDVILGWNGMDSFPCKGYVIKDGVVTPLDEYLCAVSTELKTWVDENMTQTIEDYDYETDEVTTVTAVNTGMPIASADLKTMAVWSSTPWNWDLTCIGYIFDLSAAGGVQSAVAAGSIIKADARGNLHVAPSVAAVTVYDLAGSAVMTVEHPSAVIECKLPRGVYVARATLADGSSAVLKFCK